MKTNRIGLPSGSLFQATTDLLKKVGIIVRNNGRGFIAEIEGSNIFTEAFITRPDRLPRAVASGKVDAAITGWDFVLEKGFLGKIIKVADLDYSKTSMRPARIVVFSRKDEIVDRGDIKVLSEYPELTKKIFKRSIIEFSSGTTEADVALGIFDFGVGVVETGKSLSDNGLKILETITSSPAVLITRDRSEEIEIFGEMLRGALRAEKFVLIKFNIDAGDEKKILKVIPSLESPTVNNLADGNTAIETVVLKGEMSDVIVAIKKAGGRKIIVQRLDVSM